MKKLPLLANIDNCFGCMLCQNLCPVNAISMVEDENGFWLPKIDSQTCIGCLSCEKGCAKIQNSHPENMTETPLRGFCRDTPIRSRSASGGAFAAIAMHLIKRYNAVVFGATLSNNEVFHIEIDDENKLHKLQGSKYIQSNASEIYRKVKKQLSMGRTVLFCGTPCQVEALNIFLRKPYTNLITVDLICHGVVSNKLFQRHISINNLTNVSAFRDKSLGWGKDIFFRYIENGKEKANSDWGSNFFYHAFQLETCCRPNCYKCIFSQLKRTSDITLGDYWADRNSKNYDSRGISTILPNTEKGQKIVEVSDLLEANIVDWLSTVRSNPRLLTSRPEFLKFSCSKHIGVLYKYLPSKITDCILGTRYSKRHFFFRLWLNYINRIKRDYERRYQSELSQYFNLVEK